MLGLNVGFTSSLELFTNFISFSDSKKMSLKLLTTLNNNCEYTKLYIFQHFLNYVEKLYFIN